MTAAGGTAGHPQPDGGTVLWGGETGRALANPVSDIRFPSNAIRWLAILKAEGAWVNAHLGVLDVDLADAIVRAAEQIANGDHAEQFPVDVFQTGSGTSTNMNVNEVIAAITGGRAHPNDHVNRGHSSNDVVPTAVHLASLEALSDRLLPAIDALVATFEGKAAAFAGVVKPGRTHLMDALPVTLGQELAAYSAQLFARRHAMVQARAELAAVPLGGTAVGTGVGTPPRYAPLVVGRLNQRHTDRLGVAITLLPSRLSAMGSHDALVATMCQLGTLASALTKIANDLRWMGSGPHTGLGEITLPALQKGSSIMPGKVNPVVPEIVLQVCAHVMGSQAAVTFAGSQGNFELNVMLPMMAHHVLTSIDLLARACELLADRCVDGLEPDVERCRDLAGRSRAIATVLNATLGYDEVELVVRRSEAEGRSLAEVLRDDGNAELAAELDLDRIARSTTRPS